MEFPESAFWSYSSEIWSLPDVEAICLQLQNEHELNINMLLYCCWAGEQLRCLNDDDLQTLLDTIQPWQVIIQPLRDSRRTMQQSLIAMPGEMIEQTLSNISEMELNAEHMAQLAMEKALSPQQLGDCAQRSPIECSQDNIDAYLKTLNEALEESQIQPRIRRLLEAIHGITAADRQNAG